MKTTAAASLLALVLFTGLAHAADAPAPYATGNSVELWGAYNLVGGNSGDADDDGLDQAFGQFGGKSAILFNMGSDAVGQVSTSLVHTTLKNGSADDDQVKHGGQIAGHVLSTTNGFGLFAGIGAIDYVDDDASKLAFGGLEYKSTLNAGSMLIQLGYLDANTINGDRFYALREAGFVRLAPSMVLSDSLTAKLSAAYIHGQGGGDGATDMFAGGINFEKRLEGRAVTLIAGYEGFVIDNDSGRTDEHEIKIGLRFDLRGTTPDTIDTPDAYRWVAAGQRLD